MYRINITNYQIKNKTVPIIATIMKIKLYTKVIPD